MFHVVDFRMKLQQKRFIVALPNFSDSRTTDRY